MAPSFPSWTEAQYQKIESELNGARGSEFQIARKRALDETVERGLPNQKSEEWRYTNFEHLAKEQYTQPVTAQPVSEQYVASLADASHARVIFVDGVFSTALSHLPQQSGIVCESLADFFHARPSQSQIGPFFASVPSLHERSLVGLNYGLMRDGFAIRVGRSVEASQPVEIVHIHTDQSAPTSIFPRTIVSVESSGALTCIERFVTLNQSVNLCVAVTEIIVGDGARVDYYAEAEHTPATTHYHSVQTQSGRDAQLRMHLFPSGAKVCRNEVNVHLLGTGSHTLLNGLSLPRDSQQIDTSTVIRHAVPHCESSELFKGVYRDRSRGVFQGTIIVEKDAQKTNAFQSNQAVLLSKEASSDAKPQLKIWADDVKCTHGATVGQLDEEALFYIRSRGVAPSDAQNMLLEAFVGEVLGGVRIDSLKERVRARVM